MSCADKENEVKVTNIYSALKLVSMMYLCKFNENLPSLWDIVCTRNCHTDASANTDTNTFVDLKHQAKFVADIILKFNNFVLFKRENKSWHFMWIICLADDSYEMSTYFLWIIKKKKRGLLQLWLALKGLIKTRQKKFRKKKQMIIYGWINWFRNKSGLSCSKRC